MSGCTRTVVAVAIVCGLSSPAWADEPQGGPEAPARDHIVEPEAAPSFGALFREVPRDLWRFVSLDTAAVLGAGGGAALIVPDDTATHIQRDQGTDAFSPGSTYGAFAVMLGGSFAVYGVGRLAGHTHTAVVGADLIRGQIVSQLWVQALKFTVQRERPDGSNDRSFPSGHAAGGFAAATVLARHYGWKAAIPAYLGATYIAAARVHDNRHYLSDVTFGAAMGIAGGRTVMLKAGRYGVKVAPALTPGGVALGVTVVPAGL